ncbi:MAG TPA: serine/threonine-protein kinase [Gemmataceae bacterium]
MELSVQNIYGLLIRSRLLSPPDAHAMLKRWQAQATDAANAGQFSKWMVAHGFATEYQASLLARGHAEGFFLNQYKILDRLGKGRMAGVYKALHPLGQIVAIKVLPPSKAKDPQIFGRFQREASLSVGLKHRNVVRTFQVGEAGGVHYLVMEYLEGETFDDVLQRCGKLPPAEAVPVIYQALLGLEHLHEKSMVHRDLKPANLMLLPASTSKDSAIATVKILDIGLARVLSEAGIPDKPDKPPLTSEGLLLGTPDYMAPEQARDARTADIRADIYSLGCVLYHALAGEPPFPDTNIISQMIRHASEPARPLSAFNPAVPDGLQQIVDWMMAKEPGQRYPTPDRAAKALEVFLAAGDEPAVEEKPDPNMQSYLSWLEMQIDPARTESLEKKSAVAVAAPAVRTGGRRESATPVEVPIAAPVSALQFDVDLISTPARGAIRAKSGHDLRLSRRDFLLFGIGVATVLFALAFGKLLAWLFPFKKTPAPDDGEPSRPT